MEYKEIYPKTILSRLKDKDSWFQCRYTMNIYRGCEHGCIYCDGRSTRFWPDGGNVSFSDIALVKMNAPDLLDKKLRKLTKKEVLCLGGGVNDSYQPCEQKYELTKKCLYYIKLHGFPLHMMTKSTMIERDIELIKEIAKKQWCYVSFSFSTPDKSLAKVLEPNIPSPEVRLKTMKKLTDSKIPCGVAYMPIIPYVTDSPEMLEEMFSLAKEHGASYIIDSPMTLSGYQKDYFLSQMEKAPKLRRYIKRISRLYSKHNVPYGKVMHSLNKNCFDLSAKYDIPRRMPEYTQKSDSSQKKLNNLENNDQDER